MASARGWDSDVGSRARADSPNLGGSARSRRASQTKRPDRTVACEGELGQSNPRALETADSRCQAESLRVAGAVRAAGVAELAVQTPRDAGLRCN